MRAPRRLRWRQRPVPALLEYASWQLRSHQQDDYEGSLISLTSMRVGRLPDGQRNRGAPAITKDNCEYSIDFVFHV